MPCWSFSLAYCPAQPGSIGLTTQLALVVVDELEGQVGMGVPHDVGPLGMMCVYGIGGGAAQRATPA